MERKRLYGPTPNRDLTSGENKTFIITRILGHKADMPGSGQWSLINDIKKQGDCWVCGLNKYSMVFWSKLAQVDGKLNY